MSSFRRSRETSGFHSATWSKPVALSRNHLCSQAHAFSTLAPTGCTPQVLAYKTNLLQKARRQDFALSFVSTSKYSIKTSATLESELVAHPLKACNAESLWQSSIRNRVYHNLGYEESTPHSNRRQDMKFKELRKRYKPISVYHYPKTRIFTLCVTLCVR